MFMTDLCRVSRLYTNDIKFSFFKELYIKLNLNVYSFLSKMAESGDFSVKVTSRIKTSTNDGQTTSFGFKSAKRPSVTRDCSLYHQFGLYRPYAPVCYA